MIINNTSVPGTYKFKQNVIYEHNDLIQYNGMLYVVTADKYLGELPPNESSQCTSYVDLPIDETSNGQIVTTKNISGAIEMFLKGLQLGGIISRIKINSLGQLDSYINTGVYSVNSANIIQMGKPFEAILRIYRFRLYTNEMRVVQEVVNYGDNGSYPVVPTNIWYRVGRIINGDEGSESVSWISKFTPIVSASNNHEYGNALGKLVGSMTNIMTEADNIRKKYKAAAYMHAINEEDKAHRVDENRIIIKPGDLDDPDNYKYYKDDQSYFKIPRTTSYGRTGFVTVVFGYTGDTDGKPYQDSFTCDFSDFVDHPDDEISLTSIGGLTIVIKQPSTPDSYYDYIQFFRNVSDTQEIKIANMYSDILHVLSIS